MGVGETTITASLEGTSTKATVSVIVYLVGDEIAPLGNVEFLDAYISGYTDGTFRPAKPVTRAEVATMFAKVLNLNVEYTGSQKFNDVDSVHWAFAFVQAAERKGIFKGYSDETFRPEQPISRAEIAAVFAYYWLSKDLKVDNTSNHFIKDVVSTHWAAETIESASEKQIKRND